LAQRALAPIVPDEVCTVPSSSSGNGLKSQDYFG